MFIGSSQCLSGAGWRRSLQRLSVGTHSTCQVLGYGELTLLVRCWFMWSSQCLSVLVGAGARSPCHQVQVVVGAHSACQMLVGVGARSACQV